MSDDNQTPHLRTYSVRFVPWRGLDMEPVRVNAQGFRWTENDRVELWRRIPAGEEQIVASFEAGSVVDIYEDADKGPAWTPGSVPEEWAKTYGTKKKDVKVASTPPPPSDDDVPF